MLSGFNYAHFAGIHSVAAAIVFAILYVPLFAYYVRQAIRRPTYVFIILSFFCAIRITAFTMRAILAGKASAGENLKLLIAEQIIYSVGFFGLLYSAYTLVLDRAEIATHTTPKGLIAKLIRERRLFRLALSTAVALGISGTINANLGTSTSTIRTGNDLRKASVILFLVLTCLLAFQTLILVRDERSSSTEKNAEDDKVDIGGKHGIYILCLISLLLLAREAFLVATVSNAKAQTNEQLFYPLEAVTEFLAVCLFAVKGLVPTRDELPK